MDTLWAPWRMEYILKAKEGQEEPCIFCSRIAQKTDQQNLILWRGKDAFIIMNRFPYNNGHQMVVPYQHTGNMNDLQSKEQLELYQLLQLAANALEKVMSPHGFNIGMNLGKAAGAGVPSHVHTHVVPRWRGDTNFMQVLVDVKVLPEALAETYRRLLGKFL